MKLSYFVTFNFNVLLIAIRFLEKRLTNVPDQCALKIRKETYKQHVKIPRDLTSPDLNHCLVASISYRVRSHLYLNSSWTFQDVSVGTNHQRALRGIKRTKEFQRIMQCCTMLYLADEQGLVFMLFFWPIGI